MLLSKTRQGLATLRQTAFVQKFNEFLSQPNYILLAAMLTAVSNMAQLEWVVYPLFALLGVYIFLLGEDILPVMPLFLFCYLAPSRRNNPGAYGNSFFAESGILLPVLAGVLVLALLLRIATDPKLGGKAFFTKKRSLLWGLLTLGATFVLSGLGAEGFGIKSVAFGLLQSAAFMVPYFLLTGMVDWSKARKDYFAWIGFSTGLLVLAQLCWLYVSEDIVIAVAESATETVLRIHRENIFTGWGMYNNMGVMLALAIPFAFYLATRYRKGWIGSVVGTLFLVGILFTCSRSSILFGSLGWVAGVVLMLVHAKNSKANMTALLWAVSIGVLAVLFFRRQLEDLFYQLIALGTNPSSRDWLYENALKLFWEHPGLGVSFYPPEGYGWSWSQNADFASFFPPRWHNTLVQLLATGGIAALTAYALHRIQTLQVFFRKRNREKTFIGCAVLVLLACSLLDCHLFNIGPTLFYSMALAFGECVVGER